MPETATRKLDLPNFIKQKMGFKPVKHNSKGITLHKAIVSPDFNKKTVLVRNHWDYVEMWLQKERQIEALKYWKQAESFYHASLTIPETASPPLRNIFNT